VGERGSRASDNRVGVPQGLYRPGPMRVPYWDRCDGEADLRRSEGEATSTPEDASGDEPSGLESDGSAA
jgi:hypothetical protein